MPQGLMITVFTAAAVLAWTLLAMAWRRRGQASGRALLAFASAIAAWTSVSLLASLLDDPAWRTAILRLQLALATLAPATWLWMAYRLAFARAPSRAAFALVGGLTLAAAAAALVTPVGPGGVLERVTGEMTDGRWVLAVDVGPWFWGLLLPWAYLLLGASALLLLRAWREGHGATRRQSAALLLAMLPPGAASLLQALGANPLAGYDATGLSLGLSALLLVATLTVTDWFDRHSIAFHQVFLAMREPALVVAPDGVILEANPAAQRLFGGGQDLRGEALLGVAPQLESARRATERKGGRRVLSADLRGFEASVSHLRDARGGLSASVLLLQDQRQEREREARLLAASHRDPLTGAANRRGFEAAVADALRRRGERAVGVAFIDLDGFKAVNDRFGHAAGDAVLVEVARRFRDAAREGDTVARFGGDEFAVLLPNVTPVGLAGVGERVTAALARPVDIEGHTLRLGASVGLSSAPRDGKTVEALLAKADARMYRHKMSRGSGRALGDPGAVTETPVPIATTAPEPIAATAPEPVATASPEPIATTAPEAEAIDASRPEG